MIAATSVASRVVTLALKLWIAAVGPGRRPAWPYAARRRRLLSASKVGKKPSSEMTHDPLIDGYEIQPMS